MSRTPPVPPVKPAKREPLTLTRDEVRLIRACLSSHAVMAATFGKPEHKDLENYRKLMNLSDKIGQHLKAK